MSTTLDLAPMGDRGLPGEDDSTTEYMEYINNLDLAPEGLDLSVQDFPASMLIDEGFAPHEHGTSAFAGEAKAEDASLQESNDSLQQHYSHQSNSHPSVAQAPVAQMVPLGLDRDSQTQEPSIPTAPATALAGGTGTPDNEDTEGDAMVIDQGSASPATSQPDDWQSRLDAGLRNIEDMSNEARRTGVDPFGGMAFAAAGFYESGDGEDSSDGGYDFPQPSHPMSLRANVAQVQTSGGIDRDESGDYDPYAKPTPSKATPKKGHSSLERRRSEDAEPRPYVPPTETEIRQLGHQYCIVLPIQSSKGRKKFAEIHSQHGDNWPDDSVQLFEAVNLEELSSQTYAFRQRKQAEKEADKDYYLRNTPVARGCKHCYETGQHCSMTDPDGSYPCTVCSESYEVCELLVQPKKKHACENCLSQKEPCSYTQDPMGDHLSPCSRCEFKGLTCVARPAYDPLRTRLDANGNPATPPPPVVQQQKDYSREFKTCAPCRRNNRWCSLTDGKKGNDPPCSICRKHGTPCTFEAVPRVLRQGVDNPNKRRRQSHKGDKQSHVVKIIKTSISHPITFLSTTVTNKGAYACHWCLSDNPFYAIHGHGESRLVKVYIWPDGAGYEEVENGHTLDGCEPSRMCLTCTMDRISILSCPGHELRPLTGFSEEISNDLEARERLPFGLVRDLMLFAGVSPTPPNARALRAQHKRWCAMCPNPAQFACRARTQPLNGAESRSADIRSVIRTENAEGGCGLRLCWVCASLLRSEEICGYDLQKLVKSLGNSAPREYYMRGLRADYDFLGKDGPLWRQVENLRFRYGGHLPDLG